MLIWEEVMRLLNPMTKQLERGKNRNRNRVEITDKFTNPT